MFQNRLTPQLVQLIRHSDWDDPAFSLEKAYVCCHLSALAYENIPEWELKSNNRFKIVPSESYQKLAHSGDITDIRTLISSNDLGEIFTVYRRYAVVTGIVTGDVIFLAIRGTKTAYDWLIDFNARRTSAGWREEFYHRGFYKAMMTCMDEVVTEIKKRGGNNRFKVVVTGHSLGGAMAAIFRRFYPHPYIERFPPTYTFGMPRYGNMTAVGISSPFHIYNELDMVPRVPPLSFGYENCLNEYRLDGNFIENTPSRAIISIYRWMAASMRFIPARHHFMERYLERMELLFNK
jgi:hypothetical protein